MSEAVASDVGPGSFLSTRLSCLVPANFTTQEEQELEAAMARRETPSCPRCSGAFTLQSVPPRSDVPYVRDRIWLVCEGCGRSALLDRRRLHHYDP
jgi:hypothetical protein